MKGWTNDDRMMIACCNDGTRPVIFKIERIDIPETPEEEDLSGLYLPARAEFTQEKVSICGEEVVGLKTMGWRLSSTPDSLYEEVGDAALVPQEIRLIPYFEWDNAGFREMRIWIPVRYDAK